MAWDYSRMRGYPVLDTPELVWDEIQTVADHYTAVKEASDEKTFQYEHARWLYKNTRLWESRQWFPLSILGLMMSAEFIESQLLKMIAYGAIKEVDARLRVITVALGLLFHLEYYLEDPAHLGSKEGLRDQKERLVILILGLWKTGTIDPVLSGIVALKEPDDDPEFFMKFLNAHFKALSGQEVALHKKPLH